MLANQQAGKPFAHALLRRLCQGMEIRRLRTLPSRHPTSTNIFGRTIRLVDAPTFLGMCRIIVRDRVYQFKSNRENPTIIDCGANIGLATLYWKELYPNATITAFEPDPDIFEVLSRNCKEWNLLGVRCINAAVWSSEGTLRFWCEGAECGRLLTDAASNANHVICASTVRLRDYLDGPVDLLKLDIEGAETEVLPDCRDRLDAVDHLFVEYHSFIGRPQQLDTLLSILRSANFRTYLQPGITTRRPFVVRPNVCGMDQTINIFAYRDGGAR